MVQSVNFDLPDDTTSRRMRQVGTANTPIEKRVRSALHKLGYRFRLNNVHMLGKPDIVLPKHKVVIFVHGCFWHGHEYCNKGLLRPKRNAEYWANKIDKNKERDARIIRSLELDKWKVLTIWECQTLQQSQLKILIEDLFGVNKRKFSGAAK